MDFLCPVLIVKKRTVQGLTCSKTPQSCLFSLSPFRLGGVVLCCPVMSVIIGLTIIIAFCRANPRTTWRTRLGWGG